MNELPNTKDEVLPLIHHQSKTDLQLSVITEPKEIKEIPFDYGNKDNIIS